MQHIQKICNVVLFFFVSVPMSVDLRGTKMPSKVAVLDKIARKYLQSVLLTPWVKRGNSSKGDRLLYITLQTEYLSKHPSFIVQETKSQLRPFKWLLGRFQGMLFTGKNSRYLFLSLYMFLSLCFLAVNNVCQILPKYHLKDLNLSLEDLSLIFIFFVIIFLFSQLQWFGYLIFSKKP